MTLVHEGVLPGARNPVRNKALRALNQLRRAIRNEAAFLGALDEFVVSLEKLNAITWPNGGSVVLGQDPAGELHIVIVLEEYTDEHTHKPWELAPVMLPHAASYIVHRKTGALFKCRETVDDFNQLQFVCPTPTGWVDKTHEATYAAPRGYTPEEGTQHG